MSDFAQAMKGTLLMKAVPKFVDSVHRQNNFVDNGHKQNDQVSLIWYFRPIFNTKEVVMPRCTTQYIFYYAHIP